MRTILKNLLDALGNIHLDHLGASTENMQVPSIVKSEFVSWAAPRRGQLNPEVLTNPVWAWLIETGLSPEVAHMAAGIGRRRKPGWNFGERFGQSRTALDDGSSVLIGGEYEDFYDPDFYIYNDVVVARSDGSITIYGYPEEVFQPTDFHTATKVGNGIYIIGCLGYVKDRRPNHTPVYFLDLQSFQISAVETVGEAPSWLFKHTAKLEPDTHAISVEGGRVMQESTNDLIPNDGVWKLCLRTFEWTKQKS